MPDHPSTIQPSFTETAEFTAPEAARPERLRVSNLIDTCLFHHPEEQAYEDVVVTASVLAGTAIALISLIDNRRQWFKASVGAEVQDLAPCVAFCNAAMTRQAQTGDQWLVVDDARQDPRFAAAPQVAGGRIRFLAGMPIRATVRSTQERLTIGALCVVDPAPRILAADRLRGLQALGRILENLIATKIAVSEGRLPQPLW